MFLKCNVSDGSVTNGVRLPILYTFALDQQPRLKVFCEPETTHYRKIKKPVLNTKTFFKKMTITKRLILMEKR